MAHPFAYAELHSPQVPRVRAFYGELFGWTFTEFPVPGKFYAEIATGEGFPGGLTDPQPELRQFTGWLTYVKVDDLAAATEQARRLGATIVKANVQVPDAGAYTWLIDPAGAALGLWQPIPR
ncbi:MAG: VOC family protein [Anaeromyxobacter sp.]